MMIVLTGIVFNPMIGIIGTTGKPSKEAAEKINKGITVIMNTKVEVTEMVMMRTETMLIIQTTMRMWPRSSRGWTVRTIRTQPSISCNATRTNTYGSMTCSYRVPRVHATVSANTPKSWSLRVCCCARRHRAVPASAPSAPVACATCASVSPAAWLRWVSKIMRPPSPD